jgi:hypothetical protein
MLVTKRRARKILRQSGNNGNEFSINGLDGALELKADASNYIVLSFKLYAIAWLIAMLYFIIDPLFFLGVIKLHEFMPSFVFGLIEILALVEFIFFIVTFVSALTGIFPTTAGFRCQFIKDGTFFGCITKRELMNEFVGINVMRVIYVCNRLDDVSASKYYITLYGDILLEKRKALSNGNNKVDNNNVVFERVSMLRLPLCFEGLDKIKALVGAPAYHIGELPNEY